MEDYVSRRIKGSFSSLLENKHTSTSIISSKGNF